MVDRRRRGRIGGDAKAGAAISPAVTVMVEDKFGNLVVGDKSKVTIAIASSPSKAPPKKLPVVKGPDGQPAYLVRELEELLGQTEKDILNVLNKYTELGALVDWVRDEFRRAGSLGGLETGTSLTGVSAAGTPVIETIIAGLGLPLLPPSGEDLRRAQAGRTSIKSEGEKRLVHVDEEIIGQLDEAAQNGLSVHLTLMIDKKSLEEDASLEYASLDIFYRLNPGVGAGLSPNGGSDLGVGSYSWNLYINHQKTLKLHCDANLRGPDTDCPVKLIGRRRCFILTCSSNNCLLTNEKCH